VFDSRQGQDFLFPTASKLGLGLIQPRILYFREMVSPGVSGRAVKQTSHLHLLTRSRIVELYLHSAVSRHDVYFFTYVKRKEAEL
jgi:hypothetical protein